jgi:hypothetical protein
MSLLMLMLAELGLGETVEAGVTTRLDFDAMDRLVQRRAAAPEKPEQIETFAYNANGQLAEAKNEHARVPETILQVRPQC